MGHEVLLAKMQRDTTNIQIVFGQMKQQQSGLSYKHHATVYHRDIRSKYIQDKSMLLYQQKLQHMYTTLNNICNQNISHNMSNSEILEKYN